MAAHHELNSFNSYSVSRRANDPDGSGSAAGGDIVEEFSQRSNPPDEGGSAAGTSRRSTPPDSGGSGAGTNVMQLRATPSDTPNGPGARRNVASADGRPNPGSGSGEGHYRGEVDSDPGSEGGSSEGHYRRSDPGSEGGVGEGITHGRREEDGYRAPGCRRDGC